MQITYEEVKKILNIGINISTEKDKNHLLATILDAGMDITNCDASTLYLLENDALKFKIMKTLSQNICKGADGEEIDMPPVPLKESNVCAYSAIKREIVNIPNVYEHEGFDFSGPKRYDSLTGYHTQSLLVIPLEDTQGELIGVLQLLNAKDKDGYVIPFDEEYEIIIRSLGSMSAIEITNISYVEEIKKQLHSFVEAMATAIDERTPYNGSHTRKVAEYSRMLANHINKKYEQGLCQEYFDDNRKERLHLAALLHDIGKMIVPLSVMNKATRLDSSLEKVDERFKLLQAYYEIDMLKGNISVEEYEEIKKYLKDSIQFIHKIDTMGFLDDESYERVQELASKVYTSGEGIELPYLTDGERECLSIRKGTLTSEDRQQMENHVVMTDKILSKVRFSEKYKDVPRFAASHHEQLDGSGYPNHLKGDELELETRILTVTDIYDALTAEDRPYKKPIPVDKAFAILESMANEGKIELRLVQWLREAVVN